MKLILHARRLAPALLALTLAAAGLARAETGVTDTAISIGQSAVFSGPVAATGNNYRRGIELYFEQVNKAGGLFGRKLQLTALDDGYDPKRTAENTKALVEQNKVFALIGYVATANLIAAMPIAEEAKVPLFAPLVGTTSIRLKHNRYLFHVRASYKAELARITQQLAVVGNDKVAVVYQDSVFGKSNLDTLLELIKAEKLQVVKTLPMAITAQSAADIAAQLKQASPNVIIMIMAGTMSEVLIRDVRGAGLGTPLYTISVGLADAKASAARLNGALRGVITASIVPSPALERYGIVKEYRKAVGASAGEGDNYTVLEGYIAAKVFSEGLRRAGRNLTRENFIAALEGVGTLDVGDFRVEYGPGNHNGSSFVELEMYTAAGSLIR
ncbi:ABC transporter substrate-binding protein [Polaromonas sp. JS666]|uniref:ABC transporter substrate-binding protein n=1 Tax=Polaromonas sp. (strain JS666 / ATCC BAA-500) TaxID=296591 RepID=UPI00087FA5CF|nr:ABC transporter substrate-binding protein [Polaromonas sp. JS666]SDO18943.1 ABC-type branched-chain amino acid transport system, substrate-binding protein [Polaromonas sp. JS666]